MDWSAQLGKNVLKHRTARSWSQQTLAGEADLSLRYLAGVERGEENPTLKTIVAIAAALGIRPSELLT